jgi:hypothetical protein
MTFCSPVATENQRLTRGRRDVLRCEWCVCVCARTLSCFALVTHDDGEMFARVLLTEMG